MKHYPMLTMPSQNLILTLLILLFSFTSATNRRRSARLGILNRNIPLEGKSVLNEDDFHTFFYIQTLDHFNYLPQSYATFKQKIIINSKYWLGINTSAPIFLFLCGEAPLDASYRYIGFMSENAKKFKALLLYIEHRYYGESIPFKSREESFSNATTLGYLSSAQALADYAEIVINIKKKLRAHNSPVIALGGSYGGMLASWFRLKYPHIVLGALASSSPILYFDDITPNNGYFIVASRDFQDESRSCYKTIKASWSKIDRIAALSDGLSYLSQSFNTCIPLKDVSQLKNTIAKIYIHAASYSSERVTQICHGINGAPKGSNILTRISVGLASVSDHQCLDIQSTDTDRETADGWAWQRCTEMVMPIGCGNETMFFPLPFNLTEFIQSCKDTYGVEPRPHWVTTLYGGHDMKLVLQRFGSNIIFSNGLKDPFSSGGVLEDLSESIVAITTKNGTHCLDLHISESDDPEWLVEQRVKEVKVIRGWLIKYYKDLKQRRMQ